MLQRGKIHYLGAETVFDMLLKLCLRCLKRLFVSAPSPLTLCCGSDVSVTVHCAGKQCSGCCAVTSMNYAHVQWSSVRVKHSGSPAAQCWWNRVQFFTCQSYRRSSSEETHMQTHGARGVPEACPRGLGSADHNSTAQRKVTTDHLQAGPYKTTWSDEWCLGGQAQLCSWQDLF